MPTAPLSLEPDFLHQYEQERLRWLRIRFLWFCGSLGLLWAVGAAALVTLLFLQPQNIGGSVLVAAGLKSALFLIPFLTVLRAKKPPPRARLLRLVFWMIVGYTLLQFLSAHAVAEAMTQGAHRLGIRVNLGPLAPVFLQTLLIHLFASLLIPWTPREAIRPLLPFLAIYFAGFMIALPAGHADLPITISGLTLMLVLPAPGLAVCALRQSRFIRRFTDRAVRTRYGELRHELDTARRIHDRLFPAPLTTGPFRVDYAYEPMRQIGGDFLFIARDPAAAADEPGPVNVLLIDVTGHGIAAALAVNRLHGELARIFGSQADAAPGRVLAELNRYIHLTMSQDVVFATAACFRLDPASDHLVWANAGHPPALLRKAGGELLRLESTTFLLGAADPDDFDPAENAVLFRRGDEVFAYTDGAIEARLPTGRMLGLTGLEDLLRSVWSAPAREGLCPAVLGRLKALRDGPAADDTLLVRISRAE